HLALRLLQNATEPRRCADLGRAAAHLGTAREIRLDRREELLRVPAKSAHERGHSALGLREQRRGEVLDVDLGVSVLARARSRGDDGLLGLFGELVRIDHSRWLLTFSSDRCAAIFWIASRSVSVSFCGSTTLTVTYMSPDPPPARGIP